MSKNTTVDDCGFAQIALRLYIQVQRPFMQIWGGCKILVFDLFSQTFFMEKRVTIGFY